MYKDVHVFAIREHVCVSPTVGPMTQHCDTREKHTHGKSVQTHTYEQDDDGETAKRDSAS